MLLSRGYFLVFLWVAVMMGYLWPLVMTGDWDFLYIWDDRSNFVENEVLRGSWSFQTLYTMLTMVKVKVYEPLGWLLKFLVVQTAGLNAWWIRMVSTVVHFAAGLVLAKVSALVLDIDYVLTDLKQSTGAGLDLMKRNKRSRLHFHACCVSAVVFVVHPIHVEVVGWPSAQPYTLAALFSYLALLVHVQDIHRKLSSPDNRAVDSKMLLEAVLGGDSIRTSLLSSVLYLCALLSKIISILLPSGFFLVDIWVYLQLSSRQMPNSLSLRTSYAARNLFSVTILMVFLSVTINSNLEGETVDIVDMTVSEHALKTFTAPVWILHRFLWPSKIRPHYRFQPGDFSLSNPDCLLSVAITILALARTLWKVLHRDLSKHVLAAAFFVALLLPVSGIIQHGIIVAGANRYAYLSTAIFVPYGGWAATNWLLGNSRPDNKHELPAPAWNIPQREVSHTAGPSKKQKTRMNFTLIHTSKIYAWMMWLLLTGTLLLISTNVQTHWRNEDSLYEYSLRADPADWKILGHRAEYLLRAGRCSSDDAECRHLWILANEFSPRGTLKSELYRLHVLVALGKTKSACDGYISLMKTNPNNSSVHNNAAVCFAMGGKLMEARQEFSLALQTPTHGEIVAIHRKNSRAFDEWEAQRTVHNGGKLPRYVGAMTY